MKGILIVLLLTAVLIIGGCIDKEITGEIIEKETTTTSPTTSITTSAIIKTYTTTTTSTSATTSTILPATTSSFITSTSASTTTTADRGGTTSTTTSSTTSTPTSSSSTTTTSTTTSTTILQCVGTFNATVKRIIDGDSLEVFGCEEDIRLALTDTPEYYEPGYQEAKDFTSNLCKVGFQITVDQDSGQPYSYGRIVALVYCQGEKLNAELLYEGLGEIYTYYCSISEFSDEDWAQQYGC